MKALRSDASAWTRPTRTVSTRGTSSASSTSRYPRCRRSCFGMIGSALNFGGFDTEPLHRSALPNVEALAIILQLSSLPCILDISPSLQRLQLQCRYFAPARRPAAVKTLVTFVREHSALQALELDLHTEAHDDYQGEEPNPAWSDDLQTLCTKRGILFACNDGALWVDKGDEAYEPSDAVSLACDRAS